MTQPSPRFCSACGAGLPPGARFCSQCGAAIAAPVAAPDPAAPDGERRQACVLFADLCGFTDLSQRLDAEEVRALLARYFAAVDAEIRRAGGSIDKHVGDAVMGVFGAPVSHGNDAERAVRAGLAMHAAVAALGEFGGHRLAVHVGIASGEVVAGRTGSALHSEYTVTGPAANLAARLVDRAGPGETVVSEGVVDAARRVGQVEGLGAMMLKGVEAPVRAWRVTAASDRASVPLSPMVGRVAELALLSGLIEAAAAGKGQVILLRGDPGVGKSRVVEEVLARAASSGLRCVRAGALDFGLARGHDPGGVIARALAAVAPEAASAHAVALDDLLDRARVPASAATWDAMTLAARETARRAAMTALVEAAAPGGLLIVVEDIHWADANTLGRVAAIAADARSRPLAMLLTTRIDGDPIDRAWRAASGATPLTTVDLTPLDAEDALALARAMRPELGTASPAWVTRAGGNPLFLIELARHAAELEHALPDSVQSVVQARVDRLAAADKALIQCASIAGQRVDPALLDALAPVAGGPATPSPSRLVAAGLLRLDGETLVFAHALIRDGVYATLLRARRRELHRRAAAFYAGRDTALEARHLEGAEDPGAADAYRRAAAEAVERGQIVEGLQLAERGLERAPGPAVRATLGLVRGESLLELGRTPEAEAAFRDAVAVAEASGDRCRAWLGVAASLRVQSRVDEALAALDDADEARGDDPALSLEAGRSRHLRGNLLFARGDGPGCRAEHEAALLLARSIGHVELELRALNGLGDAAYAAGRMRSALDAFERSSALCRTHGFGRVDLSNRFMIGICLGYQREFERAGEVLSAAVADADRAGGRFMQMITREAYGIVLHDAGAWAESLAMLERALAMSRELGSKRFDAIILGFMSRAIEASGRHDEALGLAREAVALAMDVGPGFVGALVQGCLALITDDAAEQGRALAEGEVLLARGCIGHNYLRFYPDAIEVCRRAGRADEALRYAAALEAYVAAEPLPWSTFHIDRARSWARDGRR